MSESILEVIERRQIEAAQLSTRRVHDHLWGALSDDDPYYEELAEACVEASPAERFEFMLIAMET